MFKLIPLTSGPIKADAGTVTFTGSLRGSTIKGGQDVKTYAGVDELVGKRGTLRIKAQNTSTESGFGYQGGVSTWSIAGGGGAYAGLKGGGHGTVVATPSRTAIGRYEGYVTAP